MLYVNCRYLVVLLLLNLRCCIMLGGSNGQAEVSFGMAQFLLLTCSSGS